MGADEAMESELGLGELAGLTVANEADILTYDVSILQGSEETTKSWSWITYLKKQYKALLHTMYMSA